MPENNKGILYAWITSLFWSVLPLKLKVAAGIIDPMTIVWFRFAFAFLGLVLILIVKDRSSFKIFFKPPVLVLLAAFALGINYYTYLFGITLTSPGNAQLIIQFGPMLLAVFGILFFKEKFVFVQLVGFNLLLIGFFLFYFNKISRMTFGRGDFHRGSFWVLIAAIAWAFYALVQKKMVKNISPQALNLVVYAVSFVLFLPLADLRGLSYLNLSQWGVMISLGVNTLVAYGLIGEALKRIPANTVGVIITINPLITLILIWVINKLGGHFVQGENLTFSGVLGAIIFLSGAILVIVGPNIKNWPKLNFWR